jgi:hypothetical protein
MILKQSIRKYTGSKIFSVNILLMALTDKIVGMGMGMGVGMGVGPE